MHLRTCAIDRPEARVDRANDFISLVTRKEKLKLKLKRPNLGWLLSMRLRADIWGALV